jgi:hypothetical protein
LNIEHDAATSGVLLINASSALIGAANGQVAVGVGHHGARVQKPHERDGFGNDDGRSVDGSDEHGVAFSCFSFLVAFVVFVWLLMIL